MALSPIKQDWVIKQKTTRTRQIKVKQDGAYADITGWTVFFTVKSNMAHPDASALISKTITTHTDAVNGETEISLSAADTNITPGSYYYDIVIQDDDTPANRHLAVEGKLTVERTNTIRES
jgi:hypothetical protein